ncbi:hypothetical protein B5S31_g5547 [[Candida] boidinii]|nr:hypothetical protein B5S29_g5860 [[Candida] boidinii]OWB75620.1 hypothetical protein B5S31_g5547 [[Candida] boidinii]OWB81016.1 hypothetical protein B5S32_g5357 [[Candida] boidinii]
MTGIELKTLKESLSSSPAVILPYHQNQTIDTKSSTNVSTSKRSLSPIRQQRPNSPIKPQQLAHQSIDYNLNNNDITDNNNNTDNSNNINSINSNNFFKKLYKILNYSSHNLQEFDSLREKFIYAISLQIFICYLIFIYFEKLNELMPLLSSLLLGGVTCCIATSLTQFYHKNYSFIKHLKFFIWGMLNGFLTNHWIQYLCFRIDNKFKRFLIDQSIGALTFQLIFVLYNCIWENSFHNIKSIYLNSIKYSYFIWPLVSFLSFNYLKEEIIFPLNCFINLIWTVTLSFLT